MIIAGVNLPFTEFAKNLKDGGLCIVEGGSIKFAIAEERVTRQKRAGGFQNAFQYALNKLNLRKKDIDLIVYSSCCEKIRSDIKIPDFEGIATLPCNHHYSHAVSAYMTSPFEEAIVLVLDAGGNLLDSKSEKWWTSAREQQSYYVAKGNTINLHSADFDKPQEAGIAEIYRAFTYYLGWPSSNYANKTMAVSAFGDANLFEERKIFSIDEAGHLSSLIENNPAEPISMVSTMLQLYHLEGMPSRIQNEPIRKCHMDLARWIQSETEKAIYSKLNWLIKKTGIKNVCLSGGVSYNCSAIGKILDRTSAKNVFVHPASGDHGQSLGNAIYGYMKANGNWQRNNFFDPYLGGEEPISLSAIEACIKEHPALLVHKQENISYAVAELLARNEIVAWFQGRSEYGPRALGNRSILANPTNAFVRDKLNIIKGRENFMPFAPSVLYERAAEFFETSFESLYMAAAFKVHKNKAHLIPAVVHADGTSRIQMVQKEHNKNFYDVISRFAELTSMPILLNTSFNGPGEPIVETLKDAIGTFIRVNIKYLAVGDFLIEKKEEAMNEYKPSQINEDGYQVRIDPRSFLELKGFLHNRFPFTKLIPRDRFQLYSDFVTWLKIGRKTTTIRFKRNGIDFPLKCVMPLLATDSFTANAFEIPVGDVAITELVVKKFKDLNDYDAQNDGFKNLTELITVLGQIYQGISANDFISIYKIELIDTKETRV